MVNILFGLCLLGIFHAALEAFYRAGPAKGRRLGALLAAGLAVALGLTFLATAMAVAGLFSIKKLLAVLALLYISVKALVRLVLKLPLFSFRWLRSLFVQGGKIPAVTAATAVIITGVTLLGLLFPTNYLFGRRDYGIYEIHAVHIATTGKMQYDDDALLSTQYAEVKGFIVPEWTALFSPYLAGEADAPGGIDPQFLPMFPALLAVGYGLGGFALMLRIPALLSALSLLCLFYLGRRFFSGSVGLLATLFLAVCPAQLWGARITQSEQLVQLLFLASALLFSLAWQKQSGGLFAACALLVGLGCFARFDHFVVLIGFCAATAYCALWEEERFNQLLPAAILQTVLGGLSLAYGFFFHRRYYVMHWENGGPLQLLVLFWLAVCGVTLVLVLWRLWRKRPFALSPLTLAVERRGWLWGLFCAALLGLWAFSYFVRPLLGDDIGALASVEFGWYISAVATPLAILGLYLLPRLGKKAGARAVGPHLFFIATGLLSVVMYTWRPSIYRDHYWVSRRWVPVNFPFLLLLAAVGAVGLWRARNRTAQPGKGKEKALLLSRRVLSLCLAGYMVGYMAWQSRLFATHTMLKDIDRQYETVVSYIPAGSVTLAPSNALASVLTFVYQRPTYLTKSFYAGAGDDFDPDVHFDVGALQQYLETHGEIYYVGDLNNLWQYTSAELLGYTGIGGDYPEPIMGSYSTRLISWYESAPVYRLTPLGEEEHPGIDMIYSLQPNALLASPQKDPVSGAVSTGEPGPVFSGNAMPLQKGSYRLTACIGGADAQSAVLSLSYGQNGVVVASQDVTRPGVYTLEFTLEADVADFSINFYSHTHALLWCDSLFLEGLNK